MLAFLKVLQPKTVEEAYEMAVKNKIAPMLAGGCWLRLGRRGAVVRGIKEILGVQFRNMATMGGSVASKFGFSDIIPALLAVHADIVTYKGGRMSMKDYMNYRERDILVEIRIPKREVPVAVEALRISRGDFPYLTGSIRRDDTNYEVYIGTRPGAPQLAEKASALHWMRQHGLHQRN